MNPDVKRSALRRAVTVVVLTGAFLWLAPPSHADPPVAQAWWWAPQNERVNLPSQLGGLLPEQPGPQGVPENGLYVAGTAASEEAIAALRFFVPEGVQPQALELVFAGSPVGDPVIRLCAVTSSWNPVQQGAWDNRPEFECADDAPVGTVSEEGTTVSFDLTGLPLTGMVDFGLAPGLDDTGSPATFQAPIEKPGVDALQLPASDGGDDAAAPFVPAAPSPPAAPQSSPATALVLPQQPAASASVNPAPLATQAPTVASGGSGSFAAAPTASGDELAMVPVSSRDTLRTVGMVGLVALAGFYAWLTRQQTRAPTSLLVFGRGASGPVIDAGVLK